MATQPTLAGIYKIQRVGSSGCYVGQSVNIAKRWRVHLTNLRRNKHHSPFLQNVFNKYGESALAFSTLELVQIPVDKAALIGAEQKWMDALQPSYNTCPAAGSIVGMKREPFSKDTLAKMSLAKIGRPLTPEHRANLSIAHKGKKQSSCTMLGRKHSEETRMKISKAVQGANTGRIPTTETRAKMSASRMGKPGTMNGRRASLETRAKMSVSRIKFLEAQCLSSQP